LLAPGSELQELSHRDDAGLTIVELKAMNMQGARVAGGEKTLLFCSDYIDIAPCIRPVGIESAQAEERFYIMQSLRCLQTAWSVSFSRHLSDGTMSFAGALEILRPTQP
jgi:hypothetical protein